MTTLSPTLELACDLIRRPSVTPVDEGCQELMMRRLGEAGFAVERMRIEEVEKKGLSAIRDAATGEKVITPFPMPGKPR